MQMMTTNKLVKAIDTAVDLVNHGRYGEAEGTYEKGDGARPGSGMAWKLLGAVLAIQGKNEEAVDPLRKAAAFLPDDVEAQANLGVILHDRGRPAEAEAAYRKALAIKPDYAEARKNLTEILEAQHEPAEEGKSGHNQLIPGIQHYVGSAARAV